RASGEDRKVFVPLGCVTIPNGSNPRASRWPAVGTERVRISRSEDESIGSLTFKVASRGRLPRAVCVSDQRGAEPSVAEGLPVGIGDAEVVAHGGGVLRDVCGLRLCLHIFSSLSLSCYGACCRREPTPGVVPVDQ